jgi:hypothetical protein
MKKLEDKTFRALYVTVVRLFSERLIEDIKIMKRLDETPKDDGEHRKELLRSLSLAGKWAPTPNCSHDRVTNIASAISLVLYRSQAMVPPEVVVPDGTVGPGPMCMLRSYYQRWVLSPLRKTLSLPEPLMSTNRWTDIKYGRVASVCMKNNMERFYIHDKAGFEEYLTAVESGQRSISGATLLPHHLLQEALNIKGEVDSAKGALKEVREKLTQSKMRVIDLQWKTLIERLRESGALDNSLAICDVSGSMGSLIPSSRSARVEPIFPAVSLAIVLAQIAKPPFNNGFISFSETPEFIRINPDTDGLCRTAEEMGRSSWGMTTDFHAVFMKLLLPLAVKNGVKQEDMIRRLFVFSDMQFDSARSTRNPDKSDWQTNHDEIATAYREAGYEVPEVVYWNLAAPADKGLRAMPVTGEQKGVALLNGFSPNLLKVFMGEEDEPMDADEQWEKVDQESMDTETDTAVEVEEKKKTEFTPVDVMKKALSKKSFNGLVVLD